MTPEEKKEYYLKNKERYRERNRINYLQNKERYRERNRIYYANNKGKMASNRTGKKRYMTEWMLKKKYGLSELEYKNLLSIQFGCCAICGKEASQYKRKLAVDHDHKNGKIRGLLCVKCNGGIGCFDENQALLDRAKEYLAKHR